MLVAALVVVVVGVALAVEVTVVLVAVVVEKSTRRVRHRIAQRSIAQYGGGSGTFWRNP